MTVDRSGCRVVDPSDERVMCRELGPAQELWECRHGDDEKGGVGEMGGGFERSLGM